MDHFPERETSTFDGAYGFVKSDHFYRGTVRFSGAARTTLHFKNVNSRPPLQPMVRRRLGRRLVVAAAMLASKQHQQ